MYQFWLPLMGVVRFGAGYAFRIPRPLVVAHEPVGCGHCGILLPGNGWPVCGSLMTTTLPKKKLLGLRSSLKSPCRISREGTVIEFESVKRYLTHSSPQYQKILFLPVLNLPGMYKGPPMVYPNWL